MPVNLPVNHRQRGNEGLPAAHWLATTFTRITDVVVAPWWPQATEWDGTMGCKSRSWAGTWPWCTREPAPHHPRAAGDRDGDKDRIPLTQGARSPPSPTAGSPWGGNPPDPQWAQTPLGCTLGARSSGTLCPTAGGTLLPHGCPLSRGGGSGGARPQQSQTNEQLQRGRGWDKSSAGANARWGVWPMRDAQWVQQTPPRRCWSGGGLQPHPPQYVPVQPSTAEGGGLWLTGMDGGAG